MQAKDTIYIKNARVHNLRGIDVRIPRNALCVITGLSGSGKSSLAFDTLYAEGQRRYVESLSAYARQFLDQMHKPDVEYIEGLSPAISIEQRASAANPRSTVGTTTEIYDYLRLLFASVGKAHCHRCRRPITRQSSQEIVDKIVGLGEGLSLQILAPVVEGRKGEYRQVFQDILREGFVRARVDGRVIEVTENIKLDKKRKHQIEIVIDRLILKTKNRKRLADSVETGLKVGKGVIKAVIASPPKAGDAISAKAKIASGASRPRNDGEHLFSERNACVHCGISFPPLEPRMFSFNSPYGACSHCDGLGNKMEIDPRLVIPDRSRSLRGGAIEAWKRGGKSIIIYLRRLLRHLASREGFSLDTPFKDLTHREQDLVLYGDGGGDRYRSFEGVVPNLERRFRSTESEYMKVEIGKFMSEQDCPKCEGNRLKPQNLAVHVGGKNIIEITQLSIDKAVTFFDDLRLTSKEDVIARQILKEIKERLRFLKNVGLDYLTLSRSSGSLSGGEAQRIRLATQIGSGLMGVLYVLDEPSIGLHQRDNRKLLDTLRSLQRLGNTLVVVEHDEATMREADYLIDLGPGAGLHGGHLVAAGTFDEVLKHPDSLTAKYLRGEEAIPVPPKRRRAKDGRTLTVTGAREHNLKGIKAQFPLGLFICITGVSGSGKSTLVDDILYRALARKLYRSRLKPGAHDKVLGTELIDKVVVIDQSPIGRTPRSNPATYTGLFGPVRDLFSRLPDSRVRGYKPGRFSFNVKGGRCEACEGDGVEIIEMHFLPDVYVDCEVCKGKRFNAQTLEVQYKGKNIADVLKLNVEQALELFDRVPAIRSKLQTLYDVGLSYVELGQSATTLSGGEAQRVKLSTELSRRSTGKTLYILDEPTTGLHFHDIAKLLNVLQALVDKGNTVLVIEHNLDVIKCADHVLDLGPEGGDKGGRIVAEGTPELVARHAQSYTGQFLKDLLKPRGASRRTVMAGSR